MKYITFFVVFFILQHIQCVAQKSSSRLHIKDFSVMNQPNAADASQTSFFLTAKIDSLQNAFKLHFKFGSDDDKNDFFEIAANVINIKGEYVIIYNNQNYKVKNYTFSIPVSLAKVQNAKSLVVTFYAEDNFKAITDKLYDKIK